MSSLETKLTEVIRYQVDLAVKRKIPDEIKILKRIDQIDSNIKEHAKGVQRVYDEFCDIKELINSDKFIKLIEIIKEFKI